MSATKEVILKKLDRLETLSEPALQEVLSFVNYLEWRLTSEERSPQLSLSAAAEFMRPYYEEGSELTKFTDTCDEDFYEYQDYA
ncbi:hypothetical protein HC928_24280 [bacterium]|nr:hypothetical protein [bacterium]